MQLIVVDPRSGRRKAFPLGEVPVRVGSAVDCDVVLPGGEIASHALDVTARPDGVVIEAVGRARFLLNEQPVSAAIVHVGDVIKLGAFQLVVAPAPIAPAASPRPAAPPLAPTVRARAGAVDIDIDVHEPDDADSDEPIDAAADEAATARVSAFATRRSRKKREEVWLGLLFLVAAGGVVAWGVNQGWFERLQKRREEPPAATPPSTPSESDSSLRALTAAPGVNEARGDAPSLPFEVDPDTGQVFDPVDTSWKKPSTTAEVDATLQKVADLIVAEEFARARWLLWRLAPSDADRARVERRRTEVDAATAKGGAEHLAFVTELVKKGKLLPARSHCIEESIERFRGTETWYTLLEKADEIEALIDERQPEARKMIERGKHARPRPADLSKRPPPPARVTIAEEMTEVQRKPSTAPSAERGGAAGGAPVAGGRGPEREGDRRRPEAAAPDAAAPDAAVAPAAPPTVEQLAAREPVKQALAALLAAKPQAFEARLEELAAAVDRAGTAAIEPLIERARALGEELAQAPEKAALAELRTRCDALKAARAEALAWIGDATQYFMLDPKAPGDVSRGEALVAAQKEAERRVDAVRALWGSELGSAPAPQVTLSEGYARRVREAQAIDALLAAQKAKLPDVTELLATRLLPRWSNKVHVRNYALDVAERARIDDDRETREVQQRVRDVDTDAIELLAMVNAYREMFGRPQLRWDPKLATSAQVAAVELAKGAKAYKEFDPQPLPEPRTEQQGGVAFLRGRFSARQALQAWCRMADVHRHLLDAEHRALGVGVEPKYWVAKFGKFLPNAAR